MMSGLWVGEISKAPYGILPRKRFENNLSTFIMLVLTPKTHKSDWEKKRTHWLLAKHNHWCAVLQRQNPFSSGRRHADAPSTIFSTASFRLWIVSSEKNQNWIDEWLLQTAMLPIQGSHIGFDGGDSFLCSCQRLRLCRAIQTVTRIFGVIGMAGSCHAPQDKELIFLEREAGGGRKKGEQNVKIC